MVAADQPTWQQAIIHYAEAKGIEAARRHFTKGLKPLLPPNSM